MKKILLSLASFASAFAIQAQTELFNEDFANEAPGWVIENLSPTSQETFQFFTQAGLTSSSSNGMVLVYGFNTTTQGRHDGNAQMTSFGFDCSGASTVFMNMEEFYLGGGDNSAERIVEVSNDSINWVQMYSSTAETEEIELLSLDISEVASEQANVYIRFRFISEYDSYWYFDDLSVVEAPSTGIEVISAEAYNMNTNNTGIYEASGDPYGGNLTVRNLGADAINSVELSYTIGGSTETTVISGLSIGALEVASIPVEDLISGEPGFYSLDFTVTKINGVEDTDMSDNSAGNSLILYNPETAFERKPLIEVFTASSCPPCRPGNENIHALLDQKDREEYVLIKYQQNFPGAGDPYFTQEALARRAYYGVNSIPRVEIDGSWDDNPAAGFANSDYLPYLDIPAINDIDIEYTIDVESQTIDYTITISSNFDFPDNEAILHIGIVEETTTRNVATNGEREFEQVMKKMIDGAAGTPLTGVSASSPLVITGSYTFNGNYRLPANASNPIDHATEHSVEEFDDLGIVAYIQHANSNQIFGAEDVLASEQVGIQDAEVSFFGLSAGPNPFEGTFNLNINSEKAAEMNVHIVDATGRTVYRGERNINAGSNQMEINLDNFATGIYEVLVTAKGVTETIKVSKL